ncbi:LCP family protein [Beduinella massiliensis]|uniref:LCP family glycopolymer transferase n=1 Tax=Beduinella massiliensis TaxID=1852363 RepID=UPI000C823423
MKNIRGSRALALLLCLLLLPLSVLAADDYPVKIDKKDLSQAASVPKSMQTIALFLLDSEESSDVETVLLASIDKSSGRACMTDIRTDILAEIPQVGYIPLAKAYAYGGPNLMMKSINELLEMNVNSYVTLDVSSFAQIADSVGGMQMPLNAEEAAALGLSEGQQTLTGKQAIAYMRLKGNNIDGKSRQYKSIMQILYQGTRDKNPISLMGLAQKLMSTMQTNLGIMDMITLATKVMGGSQRDELMLPGTAALLEGRFEDTTVYETDWAAMRQELHAFLFPQN